MNFLLGLIVGWIFRNERHEFKCNGYCGPERPEVTAEWESLKQPAKQVMPPVQAARCRVDLGSQDRWPSVAPGGSSSREVC